MPSIKTLGLVFAAAVAPLCSAVQLAGQPCKPEFNDCLEGFGCVHPSVAPDWTSFPETVYVCEAYARQNPQDGEPCQPTLDNCPVGFGCVHPSVTPEWAIDTKSVYACEALANAQ